MNLALASENNLSATRPLETSGLLSSILRHPLLMPYNRLILLVVALNSFLFFKAEFLTVEIILNFILINFTIANVIRSQYVVNTLFKVATSAPTSWPLNVRWALGKVYHFGGLHVGAYFSGACWLLFYFLGLMTNQYAASVFLISLVGVQLVVLLAVIVAALPQIRSKYHNQFELTARFGNWLLLLTFWAQTFYLEPTLFSTKTILLILITGITIVPWLRLKKITINYTKPSNHVVLADFNYGVTPFAGSSTDLSLNPLFEWHSFANVPIPNRDGFKLTISRAGDWTGRLIDQRPQHIWVKGIPTAGVGNIEKLFKKVVWVATGSGIGPCLPHLFSEKVPANLIWSTKNPERTYGSELLQDILKVQPEAVIWDTDQFGKPDLVQLALAAMQESGAEAVICIANKKVTWNVVYEMERRGIPAFGAIWDS